MEPKSIVHYTTVRSGKQNGRRESKRKEERKRKVRVNWEREKDAGKKEF